MNEKVKEKVGAKRGRRKKMPSCLVVNEVILQEEQRPGPLQ